MSLLKSLHTLLGNAYRARDYNTAFDNQESGAGYYTFEKARGEGYYILHDSMTDTQEYDPKMPHRYSIDMDSAFSQHQPPLNTTAHRQMPVMGIRPITHGAKAEQMITALPVYDDSRHIKGIFQFRASDRGLTGNDPASINRMALAEYMINAMSPFIEPRQIPALVEARQAFDTPDGAIALLSGLRDRWQVAISEWSQETYQHTVRVAELSDMIARRINDADSGPMAAIKIPEKELALFKLTAELHDLGKLYTPRGILESGVPVPGVRYELSRKETEIMNRHASDVYDVFDIPGLALLKKVRDIAASHHIHANGEGGYPEFVRRQMVEEGGVPFEGKLLAISDIFEALTADREYREGMGLTVSTSMRILHSMAKKGQVDPQILRFCIEQSIFEDFARGHAHISHYDPEFYERLGYGSDDMAKAAAYKDTMAEKTGIARDKLDALLRMSATRLFDRLDEEECKEKNARDPSFPTRAQIEALLEAKTVLRERLSGDSRGHGNENKNKNGNGHGQWPRTIDPAYVDKLLALSQGDSEQLMHEKAAVASRISGHAGNPLELAGDIARMEEAIQFDISQHRVLHMGVVIPEHYPDNSSLLKAVTGVLEDIEKAKLAQARQAILDDIPAQPLGQADGKPPRFTLFSVQRYAAGERGVGVRRG